MARRDWRLVGVNCEPEVQEALADFATQHHVSLSEAGRLLIRAALEGEGAKFVAQNLKDEGYRAGVRRGIKAVHEHMARLRVE